MATPCARQKNSRSPVVFCALEFSDAASMVGLQLIGAWDNQETTPLVVAPTDAAGFLESDFEVAQCRVARENCTDFFSCSTVSVCQIGNSNFEFYRKRLSLDVVGVRVRDRAILPVGLLERHGVIDQLTHGSPEVDCIKIKRRVDCEGYP